MLKNYTPSEWIEEDFYELTFDDGHGNGCAFDCDADGNVFTYPDPMVDKARRANLANCLANPERYKRYNKVVKYTRRFKEPAHGQCDCGAEVYLVNQYMGACECDLCGKWYNLFGQELLPPNQWKEGDDW